jgi:hypothetical protein
MQFKKLSLGMGVIAAATSALSLVPSNAYADYAPTSSDVVGVGSDTLQAAFNFLADGDHLGDAGYNGGKKNKFISFDATADANTRLSYGTGALSGTCTPGTGGTQGTGNQNTTHTDNPCTQNPTIVIRAGKSPIQRPNGSGAGYNLLKADTNTTSGKTINGLVDFARASSARGSNALFDSMTMGTENVGMLISSTSSNDLAPLSVAQIKQIYQCSTDGGSTYAPQDWSNYGGNAGTIKALLPQAGSGTRSFFLGQIGLTESQIANANSALATAGQGTCTTNVEENDPEAIDASGSPANAIEPMSQSRLFLFQGKLNDGSLNLGSSGLAYFKDPSCVGLSTVAPACTTGAALAPNVKMWTSADTGASDGNPTWFPNRNLYVYFRHADITSTKPFQGAGTPNWINTMFYNPGGPTPYMCSSGGQTLIKAAGITPACTYNVSGP